MPRLRSKLHCSMASIRRSQELTQKDLAQRCGVSRQTIVEIEKGNYNPSTIVALRLARCLGVNVEDLFQIPAETLVMGGE